MKEKLNFSEFLKVYFYSYNNRVFNIADLNKM